MGVVATCWMSSESRRTTNGFIGRCWQPGTSPEELGRATGRSARSVRLSLNRLADLGLVTQLTGNRVRLVATRPDVAVDILVARKQQELSRVQAEAPTLLDELPGDSTAGPGEHVEIVTGREAVAHRFSQLQQLTKDELLVLDRPPYAQDSSQPNSSEFDLLKRGVRCRGIYALCTFASSQTLPTPPLSWGALAGASGAAMPFQNVRASFFAVFTAIALTLPSTADRVDPAGAFVAANPVRPA